MENSSTVRYFILSRLQESRTNKLIYFSFTLLIYLLIIICNLFLILTIIVEKALHEPMYIFVCNLCVNGLFGTIGFYPKMLLDLLSGNHMISFGGCLTQAYFITTSVICEITILTVMAYDRNVAICRPLNYHAIMTSAMICKLLLVAWGVPILTLVISVSYSAVLPLCGNNIRKLYCDNWSIVNLSCVPTMPTIVAGYFAIFCQIAQVVFIVHSYIQIISVCIKTNDGRAKFTQTCVPHLLSFVNFVIATLLEYVHKVHGKDRLPQSSSNIIAVEFLVIPPLINPIIYGLSLREIKRRVGLFKDTLKKIIHWMNGI